LNLEARTIAAHFVLARINLKCAKAVRRRACYLHVSKPDGR